MSHEDTCTVRVNGEPREVAAETSVRDVVARVLARDITDDGRAADGSALGIAVALDGAVVPRSAWATTVLSDGAQLELITALQGG